MISGPTLMRAMVGIISGHCLRFCSEPILKLPVITFWKYSILKLKIEIQYGSNVVICELPLP